MRLINKIACCFLVAASAIAGERNWGHENSDLAVDPKLQLGELENGLRYAILPNAEPPGRMSIRLHVAVGSLMEEENERGLAHFVEHMVFNGSRNFPPGEMVQAMQRSGLGLGGHANAYTSFDETVYSLDLPDLQEETLDLGFTVMRDFADGALFLAEELDKERGVIISEMEAGDSVDRRMLEEFIKDLFAGNLIAERMPIGLEEVVKGAPRELFLDFYRGYYHPRRMTLVVVGDVKVEELERRIEAAFGSMDVPERERQAPDSGEFSTEGIRAIVIADDEATRDSVGLMTVAKYEEKTDTVAKRIADLPLAMANAMLTNRFNRMAKAEGSPILGGSASVDDLFALAKLTGVSLVMEKPEAWQETLRIGENELRRALEFGFTESELKEVKAQWLAQYENAVKQADTRRSQSLASQLVGVLSKGDVFTHPQESLRVFKLGLAELSAEACHKAMLEAWDLQALRIILQGKSELDVDPTEVIAAYHTASAIELEAKDEEMLSEFAYSYVGEAGEVVKSETFEDLGIERLHFANGVVVNLKQTEFSKNSISLKAVFGNGKLGLSEEQMGLDFLASLVFNEGGLEAHSSDELEQILAGKKVGVGFAIEDHQFELSGRTTPEDLELQLQLMVAQLLHPGYRDEAMRQVQKFAPMIYAQLKQTPNGVLASELGKLVAGGDRRFALPAQEEFSALELAQVKQWLQPHLQSAPLELSIVGDFERTALVKALKETFGAMPQRGKVEPITSLEPSKPLRLKQVEDSLSTPFKSKLDKALAVVIWDLGEAEDYQRARRVNLLGRLLRDRLFEIVREEMGEAYSPQTMNNQSEGVNGMNYLAAMVEGNNSTSPKIVDLLVEIGANLAENGATEDEFERALKPILNGLDASLRDNGYWLNSVLVGSSLRQWKLEAARNRDEDYATITREEVNQLAAEVLTVKGALKWLIHSTGGPEND